MDFRHRLRSSVDKILCANISFSSRMCLYTLVDETAQLSIREFSIEIMQLSKMKVIYLVKGFLTVNTVTDEKIGKFRGII